MDSSVENWGGKRKGAGRPKSSTVGVRLAVPREVWAIIEADAKRAGRSPEQEAARVLESYASAPLFATLK